MASQTNRWRHAGVFFDEATIRTRKGIGGSTVDGGVEEYVISASVPGCSRKELEDGKAEPIILYRLFLDPSGPLN